MRFAHRLGAPTPRALRSRWRRGQRMRTCKGRQSSQVCVALHDFYAPPENLRKAPADDVEYFDMGPLRLACQFDELTHRLDREAAVLASTLKGTFQSFNSNCTGGRYRAHDRIAQPQVARGASLFSDRGLRALGSLVVRCPATGP